MKREIKFRGKRIDNGEWVYGDLLHDIGGGFCIMPAAWFSTVIFEEDETQFNVEKDGRAIGGCFPVDPETVGEFTGLHDKNGKEIYEGDVIDCDMVYNGATLPHRGVVEYNNHFGAYATRNEAGQTLLHYHIISSFNLIGNIYDNPELLK